MEKSYYTKNLETGKIELHCEKSDYMSLPDSDKKEIKSRFLFSRYNKAWVSRGKFPSYSYRSALQLAKKLGFKDGGEIGEKLTFAEQMEIKKEKAERRADKYDYKSNVAEKRAEQLQEPINKMHGDIAFFTQPNINTSSGQAFTRQRNRMFKAYEKGFEEFKKSSYYSDRANTARHTADNVKPKDKAFCERRIKECDSHIRKVNKSIKEYENYIKQLEDGKTPVNSYGWTMENLTIDGCKNQIELWEDILENYISKSVYYHECLDELGGIQFSKDNIKPGYIVRVKRWNHECNVEVISIGTKNINGGQYSYADILEIVSDKESEKIDHPFVVGDKFTLQFYSYEKNCYVDKIYEVTKIGRFRITIKCGDERAKSVAVNKSYNDDSYYFAVKGAKNLIYKRAE